MQQIIIVVTFAKAEGHIFKDYCTWLWLLVGFVNELVADDGEGCCQWEPCYDIM
jgi:hypothetical protein